MSERNPHMSWVTGFTKRYKGRVAKTYVMEYTLSDLMRKNYINRADGQEFLRISGLVDFAWSITYYEDYDTPDELLIDRIADVSGYVVWVHGWTGNMFIWEDLPGLVCTSNPQLVSLSIDHNGFGKSIFDDHTPALEDCNPPAAMRTLQHFIDLIRIRRQPGGEKNKVVNFVGHSMGGATLFYLNPIVWNYGEVTRTALAPALLLEDETHRAFFQTLGLGIGILEILPALDIFERLLKPRVLRALTTGSTEEVRDIHGKQYAETPRGITGATLMAMGRLDDYEIPRDFDLFKVVLGHKDPLVGLVPAMELLGHLEFPYKNIHVVPGTHYMFSVGNETPQNAFLHAQTREMIVQDVVEMHELALERQKVGPRFGGK